MLKLKARKRDVFGKSLVKFRKNGEMPIVAYGSKVNASPFFVRTDEFKKVLKEAGESTLVVLESEEGGENTLIHEVELDPVTSEPIHADFYVVEKGQSVKVAVPLVFEGVAPAVKELNGVLVKVLQELEVEAQPQDLPHDIKVDISTLVDFDSKILVGDLKLPAKVKAEAGPEDVVASVSEAGEEVVEEAPVDLSTIEVEEKGKKEEEGAEEE